MKLVAGLTLSASLLLGGSLSKELETLAPTQLYVLNETYVKGNDFDYGLTMSAIAWQESRLGLVPINVDDVSCGVFHNLLKSVASRHNLSPTLANRNMLCMRLINDYDFSFAEALAELKYWENYWQSKGVSKVWSHTVASYNGGFKASLSGSYLKAIRAKVRVLKGKFHE